MRILLVEDDQNLGKATAEGLRESFAVDLVESAELAESALFATSYELIVLDVNLPGMSGLELLKSRRKAQDSTPVLLLTARDAIHQRVEGLNAGADDYLVKPFDLDELLARCSALIRRSSGRATPIIEHKNLTYEIATGHLEKSGSIVRLSAREKAIFDHLIQNLDRVISKGRILESIYDWGSEEISSNTIEVHIASLRRKLGRDIITTVRGVGYSIAT